MAGEWHKNGWEMDVPAIQNGFKYRLNGHRKEFRTEAVNIRMALEKF